MGVGDVWDERDMNMSAGTPPGSDRGIGLGRRDFLRRFGMLAAGTGLGAWRLLDWAWPSEGCAPKDPCNLQLAALHLSGSEASAVLAWTPPADLGGFWKYWVMRRPSGQTQFERIATIRRATRTSYVDRMISLGSSYEYQVWNVSRSGSILGASNLLGVSVGPVPVPDGETTTTTSSSTTSSSTTTTTTPSNSSQPSAAGVDRQVTGFQPDGFEVPSGQTWEVVGTVETPRNVVVRGTLRMRPGSRLRFVDVDESSFVGGGMDPLATDVGLWVVDGGRLDIQGTPRAGWNRTGTDSSWQPGDEILVAPISGFGSDLAFPAFAPGSPVPQVPGCPPAEVMNLTRDVVIEGTPTGRSHVFIRSSSPQVIRHCLIRNMGPTGKLGRYPLHFHHCEEGSRGSVVEGVVVRDCGNHAFVPHMSHGVVFRDCIAYNVLRHAYWWDPPDASNDIRFEHCLAAKVVSWWSSGEGEEKFRLTAFWLGIGTGNACVDCAAVGVGGQADTSGFHWPEIGSGRWLFEDCVAHNNAYDGIFVWDNNGTGHVISRFVGYRNGDWGIDHGAYVNDYVYRDCILVQNGSGGIQCHADSFTAPEMLRFERPVIKGSAVGFHKAASTLPRYPVLLCGAEITDCGTSVKVDDPAALVQRSGC
ncbi:MAG TPA: hypothetical protein VNO34_00545 [Actinomycetota bacterium]|nr:hypothetical protein [Actinomycetota bacterium]